MNASFHDRCRLPLLAGGLAAALWAPHAAAWGPVEDFGPNPGALDMRLHVPETASPDAPVLVLLHGCQQAALSFAESGFLAEADARGWIVVAPQQRSANNFTRCFNWFQPGDTAMAGGEAASIQSMVAHAQTLTDSDEVYLAGFSAGAAMGASLLARFPEQYTAGALFAGVPAGCADSSLSAFSCMSPGEDETPAVWTERVHTMAGTMNASWPRVLVVHGTSDYTVRVRNATELSEQWSTVHEAPADPAETTGDVTTTTYSVDGVVRVKELRVDGMGHGVPTSGAACAPSGAYVLSTDVCGAGEAAAFFAERAAPVDAGPSTDAGLDAGPDLDGGADAGPNTDGGTVDAGLSDSGNDAGAGFDAGAGLDAGGLDAGAGFDAGHSAGDAGSGLDAGAAAADAGADAGAADGGTDDAQATGCHEAGAPHAWLAGLLVLLGLRRRRA